MDITRITHLAGLTENYNRDFQPDDEIGHNRMNAQFKRLKDKLEFADPKSRESTLAIAAWCQQNIGQAFWSSVAEFLSDEGYGEAADMMREYAAESGY